MPSGTRARRPKRTSLPWTTTFALAIKNVLRQKGRTASIVAAVVAGTAGLILSQGFIRDVFVQLAEAIVHSQSGHIQLAKGGYYTYGVHQPDKFLVSDPEGDKARIASLPEVEDVMARLGFSGLLSNGRADLAVLGEGIEPDKEAKLSSFMRIAEGRRLRSDDRYSALVGKGVADALRLHIGDRVVLMVTTSDGAMNTADLEIVGIFQTFSKDYDNRAVKMPLSVAQELINTNSANTLVISLKHTSDTQRIAALLRERTVWRDQEVRTWDQLNDFYPKTVEMYKKQFGGLRLIILLMVLLGVVNAVNSSVFERTAEFGTLRALGNKGRHILRLVMVESFIIGATGVTLGIGVGAAGAYLISKIGIPMPPPPNADLPYTAYIRFSWDAAWTAAAICLSATVLAAIIPAIRVARIQIAHALRQAI
ncbi:MAG: FtsX-like permease family protein [Betaproteobacteria bacterium]|nr:FtsX-like permease family protein [Betaproteobacteria bacterium]